MATKSNDPALSWGTITQTGMFVVIITGSFWALAFGPIQDKFTNLEKRDVELRQEVKRIDAELLNRRGEFVTQFEFKQFEHRLETMNSRIGIIESTRPTTGELGAVAASTKSVLEQLEMRIRALEATTPRTIAPLTR